MVSYYLTADDYIPAACCNTSLRKIAIKKNKIYQSTKNAKDANNTNPLVRFLAPWLQYLVS